jgi:uncharacterized protein involved in propanediol utilization
MDRIELTPNQQANLGNLLKIISEAKTQQRLAEQGINAMLSAIAECRGARPEDTYRISDDGKALVKAE